MKSTVALAAAVLTFLFLGSLAFAPPWAGAFADDCIYKADSMSIQCLGDYWPCAVLCTEGDEIDCEGGDAHSNLVFAATISTGGSQKATVVSLACTLEVQCATRVHTHGTCPAASLYLYCSDDPLVLTGCKECTYTYGDWQYAAGYVLQDCDNG